MKSLVNKQVVVRLKWNNTEYKGLLLAVDGYMNLKIDDAYEYINGENKGRIGEIFIRCNNVLFIGEKQEDEEDEIVQNHSQKTDEIEIDIIKEKPQEQKNIKLESSSIKTDEVEKNINDKKLEQKS
ncbi:mRNA splicing protein SMX3, partial [Ascoidea rubescens DSM 1968]